jgi:4-amino-4-deoxy-L-arabinose transferase
MPRPRDAAALALALVALWGGLGSYGLVEPSDARYAEIAREMWASGDWAFPRLLGILHFHKPPLIYWLAAAGYSALGPGEWGARACQGVLGLGLVGLLWRFARRHLDQGAAPWAVALVATTPAVLAAGRMLTTDLLLVTAQTLALTSWYDVWSGKAGKGGRFAFYGALGLVFLAKGPVGWLVLALILGPFAWWARGQGRRRVPWGVAWGAAATAAVALPWYIYAVAETPGLLSYFLSGQLASRLQDGGMGHSHPWHYFFYVFPALGLPWILLAPSGWRRLGRDSPPLGRFLLLWGAVPPVFFSLPASKLPLYVLLSYPGLALLGAAALAGPAPPSRVMRGAGAVFVALGAALAAVGVGLVPVRGGDWAGVPPGDLAWLLLPVALAAVAAGTAALAGPPRTGAVVLAACLAACAAWSFAQGDRLPLRTARTVGLAAAAEFREGDILAEYRDLAAGLPFYAGRLPLLAGIDRETGFEAGGSRERVVNPEAFWSLWDGPGRVLAVTRARRAGELPHGRELARGSGFVLLANR